MAGRQVPAGVDRVTQVGGMKMEGGKEGARAGLKLKGGKGTETVKGVSGPSNTEVKGRKKVGISELGKNQVKESTTETFIPGAEPDWW